MLPYVFCSDIEKMYRQIFIDESQRDYQRILHRSSRITPIEGFQLITVTYGTRSAPYLATRTLRQMAIFTENQNPLGASCLKESAYIDNIFGAVIKFTHECMKLLTGNTIYLKSAKLLSLLFSKKIENKFLPRRAAF